MYKELNAVFEHPENKDLEICVSVECNRSNFETFDLIENSISLASLKSTLQNANVVYQEWERPKRPPQN